MTISQPDKTDLFELLRSVLAFFMFSINIAVKYSFTTYIKDLKATVKSSSYESHWKLRKLGFRLCQQRSTSIPFPIRRLSFAHHRIRFAKIKKKGSRTKMMYQYRRRLNVLKDQELRNIHGYEKAANYIQVKCGCTSRKYGDSLATLRVFTSGQFLINCDCIEGCNKVNLTPYEFEKHSGREGNRKWKSHIWVLIDDNKVPLWKTPLLKYYKFVSNRDNVRPKRNVCHRDEFMTCNQCGKSRRFTQRTEEHRRKYHEAVESRKNWKCSDWPFAKISCEKDEERESKRSLRGCPETPACEGCRHCVCFGCVGCRFQDCRCRTCVDFMRNAGP